MRSLLDLILTLFVLLLVWVVPRLALESRRRKQRAAQKGAQKAPAKAVPGTVNAEAVPAPDEESYDWDEKAAESWLERQRGAEASPGAQPVPLPAVPVIREEGEEPDYYSHEEAPDGRIPAVRNRRSALRRAVIWKEILESPKALHPNPFR